MAEHSRYGKELASWQFPEFIEHDRSRAWYIIAVIILILLLVYALFIDNQPTPNFLFAVILVIATIVMFFKITQKPAAIVFTIYEDGLRVGNKFYDFDEIKSFYLIYEPPEVKNLYFNFASWLQPRLQVSLEKQNPVRIREILLEYLTEDLEQENEPFSDAFGRTFKL